MSLVGNFAPILSGFYLRFLTKYLQSYTPYNQEYLFELSLKYSSIVMVFSGAIIGFLYNYIQKLYIIEQQQEQRQQQQQGKDQKEQQSQENDQKEQIQEQQSTNPSNNLTSSNDNNEKITNSHHLKEKKKKLSFFESLNVLRKDSYLTNIAKLVLSYGLAIEFTEIIWKAIVKKGKK